MGIGSIHPLDWRAKPYFYSKKEAQTPRAEFVKCEVVLGVEIMVGRFEFMGGKYSTYIEVSHLVLEAFTSNHSIQVAKPPSMSEFAPLLWK